MALDWTDARPQEEQDKYPLPKREKRAFRLRMRIEQSYRPEMQVTEFIVIVQDIDTKVWAKSTFVLTEQLMARADDEMLKAYIRDETNVAAKKLIEKLAVSNPISFTKETFTVSPDLEMK